MPRASRSLAIVLAASSTITLMGTLAGCDGDAASRADKRVAKQIQEALGSPNAMDLLKQAAAEDNASPAGKARAKAALANAELEAGRAQIRQIDQNENRIATLVWEIEQLGRSLQTSTKLIEAYRSYDPSVVTKQAEALQTEAKGDKIEVKSPDKQGTIATLPGTQAIAQTITKLQADLAKQKGELEQQEARRAELTKQADDVLAQSEKAKGREAVDLYAKASGLRKDAAAVSSQIDTTNAMITRLTADIAAAQEQQAILGGLAQGLQQGAAGTEKGFKEVAAQEDAQKKLVQEIYGSANNAATTNPAATPATIRAKGAELARLVSETQQLRTSAAETLNSAAAHYADARAAAEDFQRAINDVMDVPANANAPQRQAWEDMKAIVNSDQYRLMRAGALQTLGNLYSSESENLLSRQRLAKELAANLAGSNLAVPDELAAKDVAAALKAARENMDKAYTEANEEASGVIDAPKATPDQKNAARVAQILILHAWGTAQNSVGATAEGKQNLTKVKSLVAGAVADDVTLPALPADIAPAPKVATTVPAAHAPAAGPGVAPASAPSAEPKTTPAAEPKAETPAPGAETPAPAN